MAMTSAQVLIGRGRREGRAEGRQEMLMEILLEQLEFRFGPLPEEIQERLKGMPQRQLRTLAVKAITAESLSELGLTPERGA